MTEDYLGLSIYLCNLSQGLLALFQLTSSVETLEESIELGRKAVALTAQGHTNLSLYVYSLANGLLSKFNLTKEMGALDESIQLLRNIIKSIPDGDPHLSLCLNTLGHALLTKFKSSGSVDLLQQSIECGREALALISEDDTTFCIFVTGLAMALQSGFEVTRSMENLNESIDLAERCLRSTSSSNPIHLSAYACTLVTSLFKKTTNIAERKVWTESFLSEMFELYGATRGYYNISGTLLWWPEEFDEAVISYENALRCNPENCAASAVENFVHDASCDICNGMVLGIRYKCKDCANYDVCGKCMTSVSGKHEVNHVFSRIPRSDEWNIL